jgi:hypothetical protein
MNWYHRVLASVSQWVAKRPDWPLSKHLEAAIKSHYQPLPFAVLDAAKSLQPGEVKYQQAMDLLPDRAFSPERPRRPKKKGWHLMYEFYYHNGKRPIYFRVESHEVMPEALVQAPVINAVVMRGTTLPFHPKMYSIIGALEGQPRYARTITVGDPSQFLKELDQAFRDLGSDEPDGGDNDQPKDPNPVQPELVGV